MSGNRAVQIELFDGDSTDAHSPSTARIRQRLPGFRKRVLDLAIAIPVSLLLLPPLCLVAWIAQRFQSPGPLFYRQERVGRNQSGFRIFKLRTMNVPVEGETEISDDASHRIFPLGTLLRNSKLDEIPQVLNVLAGDMSIVGPRPHHHEDCQRCTRENPQYPGRFIARPGITGLAQYSEYRGDFEWNCVENRVDRDLRYIREWSFMLDVRLIFKTLNRVSRRAVADLLARMPFLRRPTEEPVIYSISDAQPAERDQEVEERRAA